MSETQPITIEIFETSEGFEWKLHNDNDNKLINKIKSTLEKYKLEEERKNTIKFFLSLIDSLYLDLVHDSNDNPKKEIIFYREGVYALLIFPLRVNNSYTWKGISWELKDYSKNKIFVGTYEDKNKISDKDEFIIYLKKYLE